MARDRSGSDGAPPVFGVYGVPQQWPHIRALYQRAGFRHTRHTDIVYLARVGDLPRPSVNSGVTIELSVRCRRCARQGSSPVPSAESPGVVRFTDELLDRLGPDADMSKLPAG